MDIFLGIGEDGKPIKINDEQFRRHLYLLGLSGTGKSTTMASVFLQTIASESPRYGAILFDPIGDLTRNIRRRIPASRRKDVIIINPLDRDYPVALNPFAGNPNDQDIDLVLAQLMAMYQLLFEDRLDPQVEGVLRGVTMTQLVARGDDEVFYPAFDEVPPMLVLETAGDTTKPWYKRNPTTYRAAAAYEYLRESGLAYIWEAYDRLTPNPQARLANTVISKFDRFLGIPIIRNMVCQPGSIDFGRVVDEGKIVLVNLAEQTLGEASNFLAAVIMAKVLAAVYGQRELEVDDRPRFAIFADEFYRYATAPFMDLFRKGRNFGATVVVGHTDRGLLWPSQRAALENAQNILCFNLSAADSYGDMARTYDSTPPPGEPEYKAIYEGWDPPASEAGYYTHADEATTAKDMAKDFSEAKVALEALSELISSGFRLAVSSRRTTMRNLVESLPMIAEGGSLPYDADYWVGFAEDAQQYPSVVNWAKQFDTWRTQQMRNQALEGSQVDTKWDSQETVEWMCRNVPPAEVVEIAKEILRANATWIEQYGTFVAKPAYRQSYDHLVMDGLTVDGSTYNRVLSSQAGPTLHRLVAGRARPYSDVYQQIANELCHQPDYQARAKLSGRSNRPIEVTVRTQALSPTNALHTDDEQFFQEETRRLYCRHVSEVEQLLKDRESARREIIESAEREGFSLNEAQNKKFEQHPDGLSN